MNTFVSIKKTGFIAKGTPSKYECLANGFDADLSILKKKTKVKLRM